MSVLAVAVSTPPEAAAGVAELGDQIAATAGLWGPGLLAMAALTLASAFFSGSETAFFSITPDDERDLRRGTGAERRVADLLIDHDRLLTAILFWNLLINLTYFAVGVVVARQLYQAGSPILAGLYNLIALVAIIIFGEVVPKNLAVARKLSLARRVAPFLARATTVVDPVRPALTRAATAIRRGFYPTIQREPHLDPNDLELAIRTGAESADDEANIAAFERILDLLELTAEDVMRPRASLMSLRPLGDPRGQMLLAGEVVLVGSGDGDPRQAAAAHRVGPDGYVARSDLRELTYVPWSTPVALTFDTLQNPQVEAVGVVSEYGDLIGVITADDVLESLVTSKASRARRVLRREPIRSLGNGRLLVEGMTSLRLLGERLGLDDADVAVHVGESRTVAGLVQEELSRDVGPGDSIVWLGHRVAVVEVPKPGEFLLQVDPAEAE